MSAEDPNQGKYSHPIRVSGISSDFSLDSLSGLSQHKDWLKWWISEAVRQTSEGNEENFDQVLLRTADPGPAKALAECATILESIARPDSHLILVQTNEETLRKALESVAIIDSVSNEIL